MEDDELDEYADKSLEELFQQFVEAVKTLPTENKDEMVKDLNAKEKDKK